MPKTLSLSVENLQEIYSLLQTVAAQNLADGNCTVEEKKLIEVNKIDFFLTQGDLSKWNGDVPGFSLNGIWHGDFQTLKAVYDKAVELDRSDGSFDGKIERKYGVVDITVEGPKKTNWSEMIRPYKESVFPIKRTTADDTGNGQGTAWIIEKEDLGNGEYRYWCITNAHVVNKFDQQELKYTIELPNRNEVAATLKGADHIFDTGVVYFDSEQDLTPVPIDAGASVAVNDRVLILGNQSAGGIILTPGTLNAVNKYQNGDIMQFYQDDSAAMKGNSGSPLFNEDGKVIGVCNSGSDNGENYSIPIRYVIDSYRKIKKSGFSKHGTLDVNWKFLVGAELKALGISSKFLTGYFVSSVQIDSLAERSGLKHGDVILNYDGNTSSPKEMMKMDDLIAQKEDGYKVELKVFRDGRYLDILVPVETIVDGINPTYETGFGFIVIEVDARFKRLLGFSNDPDGLLIRECNTNNDKRKCGNLGILYKVNDTPIGSINGFIRYINSSNDEVFLFRYLYQHDGKYSEGLKSVANKNALP